MSRRRGPAVMEPLRWALPPRPVEREVMTRSARTDAGRPPLLFVHGANHGAWCWQAWMDAAAERGWSSWAVSLRGHGASGGAERLRWSSLRGYEHDVMQTIIDLPSPPVVIGHSLGAIVLRRVLARYPARAAVFVAPAGARHGIETFVRVLRRHPATIGRIVTGRPFRLFADDLFPDPDSDVARAIEARLGLESPLIGWELTLAPRPVQASCPVLVLGGSSDPLVNPLEFVRTARLYGTRARLFGGVGHEVMLEPAGHGALAVMLEWLEATCVQSGTEP